ncbi:lipoprotein [Mycoplasmopsis bovigenitalium]|uniref:Lipoprotein n=1 Tax=Mycoplasmopsis bovigenitalium TaxID=2112 RepID=A0A449A8L1_9BACT|nr:hypothetical protein [Mycoplasmopsis bovigenitalium]VEU60561.1 lipoprotein [Mycoplasmopsis bovigenitalium]
MKKKLGFLLTSCMTVSALPLFAAACKNENKQTKEDEAEIDVNTLFKISLPKNSNKKPSELKPEDIVVEILNNDINVEIKKVEFKEGKGVLVSYLATNSKTNKIVDEKTITLELTTKKDQEPKQDKKYDDFVTVSVEDKTKKKSSDEVTKEDIKISIKEGETFKATVESVSVPKKQLDSVNVKIKIVDGEVTKHIYKKIEGFVKAYPKEVKDGYTKFKDLKIVDDSKAHEWLNKNNSETVIYYDRESGKFFVSKPKTEDNNDNLAIFQVKSKPKNTIETVAPKGSIKDNVNEESYKATALLIKEGEKVGIKFRISLYDHKTKKPIFYEKVETSNLLEIGKAKISKPITPESGKNDIQGDQPPVENNGLSEKDKDATKDKPAETEKKDNPDKKVDSGTNEALKEKENPATPSTSPTNSETNEDTDDKNKTETNQSENQDAPKTEADKKETPNSTTNETINKEGTTSPNSNTSDNNSEQPLNNEKPKEEAQKDPKASESSSSGKYDDNKDNPIDKTEKEISTKPETDPSNSEIPKENKDNLIEEKSKEFPIPELYKASESGVVFILNNGANKKSLLESLEGVNNNRIVIENGVLKIPLKNNKKKTINDISITESINPELRKKINTHKKNKTDANIGYKFNTRGQGIQVETIDGNKIRFSWYLIDNNKSNESKEKVYTQEIELPN